ncbi:MAG: ABC transporter permease [Blastocatellia bacterium]|nr:ABC transporter permease [Blastocatellia bacterium]
MKKHERIHLWLLRFIGLIVPQRLRADWRQEWEAELHYREAQLAEWDKLNWQTKLKLFRASCGALWDALLPQPERWEDEMMQDLRYGARMLRKDKGFTLIAVVTLALGIGANTAIFSVVNGVLLKSLSFPQVERLMFVYEASPTSQQLSVPYLNLRDWQQQQRVFANITGFTTESVVLTGAGEPERLTGRIVTANFLATLGASLALGRTFTDDEDRPGGARVVILSHQVWQQHFGGAPQLLGQTIQLSNNSYTVIGILPAGFDFYGRNNLNNDYLLPLGQTADRDFMRDRGAHPGIQVIGRLQAGITQAQARTEMKALAVRIARDNPVEDATHTVEMKPWLDDYVGEMGQPLWVMQAAVGLVLLIACANVANLLLARGTTRRREIAMRMAVGARRWRVLRQLLTEGLLLASAGGVLGGLLAWWGVALLVKLKPVGVPRLEDVTLDGRVLAFTGLVTLLTGVLFGLAPAWQAARTDVYAVLKDGARQQASSGHWLRSTLVIAEVALSLLLLIGAGLLWQSYRRVLRVDPGFDAQNVLTMRLHLPAAKYAKAEQLLAFYEETLRRVAALPGIQHASLTNGFPLSAATTISYTVEGEAPTTNHGDVIVQSVNPDYHHALGIELLVGRHFTAQDNAVSAPVVIVDEAFARKHFAALLLNEVLGKRVEVGGDKLPWREIIGIVRQIRHNGREDAGRPEIYRLWSQMGPGWTAKRMYAMDLVVKTAADPRGFIAPIKQAIQSIDNEQPVGNVHTLDSLLDESIATRRFTLWLLGLFTTIAVLLTMTGVYSVMAYMVTQRTQEIGIRTALGAQAKDVLKLILEQGGKLALWGVLCGLVAALALTRLLQALLFQIRATDPPTLAAAALLLAFIALLACWLPARRATKVDPMIALRHE